MIKLIFLMVFISGCAHYQYYVKCKRDDGTTFYEQTIDEDQLELPDDRSFFIIRDQDGSKKLFRSNKCMIIRSDLNLGIP